MSRPRPYSAPMAGTPIPCRIRTEACLLYGHCMSCRRQQASREAQRTVAADVLVTGEQSRIAERHATRERLVTDGDDGGGCAAFRLNLTVRLSLGIANSKLVKFLYYSFTKVGREELTLERSGCLEQCTFALIRTRRRAGTPGETQEVCSRLFFGTRCIRKSIWSARMRRFLRIRNSKRPGRYGR